NPTVGGSGTFTVVDNGVNDADPAVGVIKVANVKVGTTYTVNIGRPPGRDTLDPSPRRTATEPTSGNLNVSSGTLGQDAPAAAGDFHDPLGSITWEKRDTAGNLITVAGATFTVSPNPTVGGSGTFTVVDNGVNDADPAVGVIKVANVKVGTTYTV